MHLQVEFALVLSIMKKKIIFADIAIMRPILIMCIVVGHAFTIYTNSSYWPLPTGCYPNVFLSWINPTLISFALQAFVFVSGYLFAYKSQDSVDKVSFLKSKLKRLYLPSILFSVLYILILFPDKFQTWAVFGEIFSGAGHLWFLPMLFWCYIGGLFVPQKYRTFSLLTVFVLLFGSYSSFLIPNFLRISNALHYFVYFFLGMWTFSYKGTISNYLDSKRWIVICSWFTIVVLCVLNLILHNPQYNSLSYSFFRVSVNILLGIIGSMSLFFTINILLNKFYFLKNINTRHNIWFGIYIYHQFILIYIYYHTNIPSYLGNFSPFVALAITIFASFILVQLTIQTRLGRLLIG